MSPPRGVRLARVPTPRPERCLFCVCDNSCSVGWQTIATNCEGSVKNSCDASIFSLRVCESLARQPGQIDANDLRLASDFSRKGRGNSPAPPSRKFGSRDPAVNESLRCETARTPACRGPPRPSLPVLRNHSASTVRPADRSTFDRYHLSRPVGDCRRVDARRIGRDESPARSALQRSERLGPAAEKIDCPWGSGGDRPTDRDRDVGLRRLARFPRRGAHVAGIGGGFAIPGALAVVAAFSHWARSRLRILGESERRKAALRMIPLSACPPQSAPYVAPHSIAHSVCWGSVCWGFRLSAWLNQRRRRPMSRRRRPIPASVWKPCRRRMNN